MIKNILIVTLRNLLKNRLYTFINIIGLAVGLTCILLISLFIQDELSYDRFHSKADRIYRVTRYWKENGVKQMHIGHVAPPIGPLLSQDFPDLEAVVRFWSLPGGVFLQDNQPVRENGGYYAEENVFDVFDFEVTMGNPETALKRPFCVMLSEEIAKKYFQNENPIGQTLTYKFKKKRYSLEVTGVFKEFPYNAHFHPKFMLSFSTLNHKGIYSISNDSANWGREGLTKNWGNNAFLTYILIPENYDVERVASKLSNFMDERFGTLAKAQGWIDPNTTGKASDFTNLELQALTDIHLHSHLDTEEEANGDIMNVYIFSLIALFILLIAAINFVNLSTARSANRAKEVGIRKVVGAVRGSLMRQFLGESILLTLMASLLALGMAELALPSMNNLLAKELSIWNLMHPSWILLGLLVVLGVGVLAGLYPAIYLSSFRPVLVLKGKINSGAKRSNLRRILVTSQFAISISLMVCTAIVYQQLNYVKSKSLGIDRDHVVNFPYFAELHPKFESFRDELLKNPNIREVSRSSQTPSSRLLDAFGTVKLIQGDSIVETHVSAKVIAVDHHFMDTYNVSFLGGRDFSKKYRRDDSSAFIINAKSAKMMGWKDPAQAVDQSIVYDGVRGSIIGVIKDFHFESLHEAIKPSIFIMSANGHWYNGLSIKLQSNNLSDALTHLENTWRAFLPEAPFEYRFLDEAYQQMYEAEESWGLLFFIFAGLAIFIACLGLFGLVSFMAQQRMKEIGIRKVLGATVFSIFRLMSWDFIVLIVLANLIALPIASYAMASWLENFAYRLELISYWYIFLLGGLVALMIALVTVCTQVLKVAHINPVKVLRNE